MKRTTKFIALGLLSCSCLTGCFGKTSSKKKGSSKTQVSFSEWKALAEACPYKEMKTAEAKIDAAGELPNLGSYKIKGTQYYEYSEGKWSMTREEVEGSGFNANDFVGMKMIDYVSELESSINMASDDFKYTFKFYADLSMDIKVDVASEGLKGTGRVAFDFNGFASYIKEDGTFGGTVAQDGTKTFFSVNSTIEITYFA